MGMRTWKGRGSGIHEHGVEKEESRTKKRREKEGKGGDWRKEQQDKFKEGVIENMKGHKS